MAVGLATAGSAAARLSTMAPPDVGDARWTAMKDRVKRIHGLLDQVLVDPLLPEDVLTRLGVRLGTAMQIRGLEIQREMAKVHGEAHG